MQRPLKQSVASPVTVVLGPFINPTDGTAKTDLSMASTDVMLSKNGNTFAQKNDATAPAHMSGGNYSVVLNSTDTNTLGILTVSINKTGASPITLDFVVLQANVYESLVAGVEYLETHPGKFDGTGTPFSLLKRDGSTQQGTRTLTTSASAEPITKAV